MSAKTFDVDTDIPGQLQAVENSTRNPSMSKKPENDQIAKILQNMVKSRLFGSQPWMARDATAGFMKQVFIDMGLLQPSTYCYDPDDPDDPDDSVYFEETPLGEEYDINLILLMAGINDGTEFYGPSFDTAHLIYNFPKRLFDAFLISDFDFEAVVKPFIRRAYYEYYNIGPGSDEDPLMRPPVTDAAAIDAVNAPPLH